LSIPITQVMPASSAMSIAPATPHRRRPGRRHFGIARPRNALQSGQSKLPQSVAPMIMKKSESNITATASTSFVHTLIDHVNLLQSELFSRKLAAVPISAMAACFYFLRLRLQLVSGFDHFWGSRPCPERGGWPT
jgi:hypothetical protein